MPHLYDYICKHCGKAFKSRYQDRKYCCIRCAYDDRIGKPRHPNAGKKRTKKPTQFICQYCGDPFERMVYSSSKSTFEFCSPVCRNKFRIIKKSPNPVRKKNTRPPKKPKTVKHAIQPKEFICIGCNKPFMKVWYPSRLRPQYCSPGCRKKRITIKCQVCSKEYETHQYRDTKYCSRQCMTYAARRNAKRCEWCGRTFRATTSDKRYCRLQCAADDRKSTRIRKFCETCGKPFIVKKGYIHARFCSMQCSAIGIALHGPDNPNWIDGSSINRSKGPNWKEQSKKARKRDGHRCQICNKRQKKDTFPVHHIIPFRTFDDYKVANQLTNLITLCRRCHGKVESGIIACPQPLF